VCGNAGLVSVVRDLRSVLGGVLDAHSAYLLLRGIKTLSLRVERQNAPLCGLPAGCTSTRVERVYYPACPATPTRVARAQMTRFGGW
jgi:cystathionine gamma-synthase